MIILCADLERSCVSVKDVRPFTNVAPTTARTMGGRRLTWRLPMTLSNRYLLDSGSTNPDSVLIAVSTNPSSRIPVLGRISAQISGRARQLIFFSAFFAVSAVAGKTVAVVAIKQFLYRRVFRGYLLDAPSSHATTSRQRSIRPCKKERAGNFPHPRGTSPQR